MKLPSIPQIPKIPKLSAEELREKLPFQPRREFVMNDSEHPVDSAAMEYRPSTGYVAPQAPAQPVQPVQPPMYRNIDDQVPFRQELVYPGGENRVPYAAGGQARTEFSGSWPPAPAAEPKPAYAPPRQETVPPAFAQAEYYVPRQNYRPSPAYAQPPVYAVPPQPYYTPYAGYPNNAPQAAPTYPEHPRPQKAADAPAAEKKEQPGLGLRLAAMVGALFSGRGKSQPKASSPRPAAQPGPNRAPRPQPGTAPEGYPSQPATPPQPPRPAIRPTELKYYIWSGSIVTGLLLTLVSFVYACAA